MTFRSANDGVAVQGVEQHRAVGEEDIGLAIEHRLQALRVVLDRHDLARELERRQPLADDLLSRACRRPRRSSALRHVLGRRAAPERTDGPGLSVSALDRRRVRAHQRAYATLEDGNGEGDSLRAERVTGSPHSSRIFFSRSMASRFSALTRIQEICSSFKTDLGLRELDHFLAELDRVADRLARLVVVGEGLGVARSSRW